jgi:hypothetical protein
MALLSKFVIVSSSSIASSNIVIKSSKKKYIKLIPHTIFNPFQ